MSTSIETLDFNASGDMVPLNNNPVAPPPQTVKSNDNPNSYDQQRQEITNTLRENVAENNVDKKQIQEMMDLATPLDEVMDVAPAQDQQMQMMAPPQAQPMMAQPPMMAPPQEPQAAPKKAKSQNPGGLNDEQMDALLVACAAVLAFSPQVREQMAKYAPQLFDEQGVRTLAGTAVTGLVAAGAFYGVKKFVLNK